jgi:DnaK suppressor protein
MDVEGFEADLKARLGELKARQQHIATDLAEPLNADSSEQAMEVQDDTSLERQAALVAQEIGSVNRALVRIENGTYGRCVLCEDDIALERLQARPEASLCIECARKEH